MQLISKKRFEVVHSKRHMPCNMKAKEVRRSARASTQLFGTNVANITAPWIPSSDCPFPHPILILRAVHSGKLNWIAVQGHGGEKWW